MIAPGYNPNNDAQYPGQHASHHGMTTSQYPGPINAVQYPGQFASQNGMPSPYPYPVAQTYAPVNTGGMIPSSVVVPVAMNGLAPVATTPVQFTAPMLQGELKAANGMVIQQEMQLMEVVSQSMGMPFEQPNKYKVGWLPSGRHVKNDQDDPNGWSPTHRELQAVATFFQGVEESDECSRMWYTALGIRNLRPMKIHFLVHGTTRDVYFIDRQFQCGGCCGQPLEMNLYEASQNSSTPRLVGRVRENFEPYFGKCFACCCMATVYHDIERVNERSSQLELQYSLRANTSCCGRVNNCCGATCCKNDMVFDILDANGSIVAHLQKTFGGGNSCEQCCQANVRAEYDFDNYILEFPAHSTVEDRLLLMTSVFQLDFHLFEKPNNNNNNNRHQHSQVVFQF